MSRLSGKEVDKPHNREELELQFGNAAIEVLTAMLIS